MKTFMLILFTLITFVSLSQDTITNNNLIESNVKKRIVIGPNLTDGEKFKYSGLELMAYSKSYYSGLRLSVAGTLLLTMGVYEISSGRRSLGGGLTIVGGVLTAVGTRYILGSSLHIKNAGLILSGNGVGIEIKM
jgi:hypothetical protein